MTICAAGVRHRHEIEPSLHVGHHRSGTSLSFMQIIVIILASNQFIPVTIISDCFGSSLSGDEVNWRGLPKLFIIGCVV